MAKYMSVSSANLMFPGYEDYPNISSTESLIGMKKNYGWNIKRVLQIGSYYYLLEEHPNADKYFRME